MDAAQYLRKSRMEAGLETDEVLERHREALAAYAAAHGINIIATYCEVVSGESLYARPEMLRLLEDVEAGQYDAVLCMDLDRLSRGRMKDQGIVLDAFRESGTIIITPDKTYDLADEIDDELAEFKTFMSRREYKIINKRLRRGLKQTIQAGCYVANAPYGYKKTMVGRQPTLEIYEPEAKFVRMMYRMYAEGYGCISIARHINLLGARPHRVNEFGRSSVATILRNPTYIGKIVWDQKKHIRKGSKGNPKNITIYQPRENWTIVDGLHPAIIEKELYEKVQQIMDGRYIPSKQDGTIKSPLAGLVKCTVCGRNMQRMQMNKDPYLLCNTRNCCASAKFELVEQRVLQHLREALDDLNAAKEGQAVRAVDQAGMEAELAEVRRELKLAGGQKNRLYELLELGEYDLEIFRERMSAVKEKIGNLEGMENILLQNIERAAKTNPAAQAKKIAAVLESYEESDGAQRNALLKSVIDTVWYTKPKKTKPAAFSLVIDLKPF